MSRCTRMGPGGNTITNNSTNIFNKYQSGSGVGASGVSNHRLKNRLAGVYVYRQCDTITNINLSDINLENNVTISLCQSLSIPFGETLVIPATKVFNNYGTIIVNGTITNNGVINNYGTITIVNVINNTSTSGSLIAIINNYGNIDITNVNGRINNYTGSIFNNQSSGIITNYGRIFQGGDNTYGAATFNNNGILKNTGIAASIAIENYFVFINYGIIFNNDSGFGMNIAESPGGSLINYNIIYNYNGSYINVPGGCTFENYGTLYNGGASCGGVHPSYNTSPSPLGTVITGCPP